MANRTPIQPTAEFERLCEERDDLAVKLSLLADTDDADRLKMAALTSRIFDLDKQIKAAWKGPLP